MEYRALQSNVFKYLYHFVLAFVKKTFYKDKPYEDLQLVFK